MVMGHKHTFFLVQTVLDEILYPARFFSCGSLKKKKKNLKWLLKQQQQLCLHGRFLQEMLMTQEKRSLGAELLLPEVVGSVVALVVEDYRDSKSD